MDLIQVGGSLLSIILIAWLTSKLFPNNSRLTVDRIERNIRRYCPDISFTQADIQVFLGTDEMSAVVLFDNGEDGIATTTALGDRVVVRHIPSRDELVVNETAGGLTITTGDFTQPSIKLLLDDEARDRLQLALTTSVAPERNPAHA